MKDGNKRRLVSKTRKAHARLARIKRQAELDNDKNANRFLELAAIIAHHHEIDLETFGKLCNEKVDTDFVESTGNSEHEPIGIFHGQ